MTAPVTQLEYRQLIEDCLDDLAELGCGRPCGSPTAGGAR